MKHLILVVAIMSTNAFAAVGDPVYQAVFHLTENGKKAGSASIITPEGKEGVITSKSDASESTYKITVKSAPGSSLQIDYRFEGIKDKKRVEVLETFVPMTLGKPIISRLTDSAGDIFEVNIVVTKTK